MALGSKDGTLVSEISAFLKQTSESPVVLRPYEEDAGSCYLKRDVDFQ